MVFSLNRAELCLDNLESAGQRAGFQNEAQRLLGRTRAELEYRSLVRRRRRPARRDGAAAAHLREATDAITRRYFAGAEAVLRLAPGLGRAMSMQLRIVHTTAFEYAGKATASFNEARLTPQTTPGQIVVHTRLEVHPTPWTYTYRDYWGTAGDRVRGARPARVADRVGDGDGAHRPRRARSPAALVGRRA